MLAVQYTENNARWNDSHLRKTRCCSFQCSCLSILKQVYRYKPIIYKRACCCNYKESISVIRQLLFWKYFINSKIQRKGICEKFNLVIVRDGTYKLYKRWFLTTSVKQKTTRRGEKWPINEFSGQVLIKLIQKTVIDIRLVFLIVKRFSFCSNKGHSITGE